MNISFSKKNQQKLIFDNFYVQNLMFNNPYHFILFYFILFYSILFYSFLDFN